MQRLIAPLALSAAVVLSALGSPAFARDARGLEVVAAAFGNTVVSTYPDGRKARLWLKEDGSYTATGRRGKPSSGVWSIKDDKICLKQKKPSAVPFSYCTATPNGGVGASWKAKAVTGEPIIVTLVKGKA
jgi:hypothetical protein